MAPSELRLLAVEDDEVDIAALRRAFARRGLLDRLCVIPDSLEALAQLRAGLPWPYVLLLDLALPRMSGLELVAQLRQDPQLAGTVVYLMTTSRHPREIMLAQQLGVRAFLNKEEMGSDYAALFALLEGHGLLSDQA